MSKQVASWSIGPKTRTLMHAVDGDSKVTVCGKSMSRRPGLKVEPVPADIKPFRCMRCWPGRK